MIEKIYCINLDRRPDRWNSVRQQFDKHGLTVERFPAIDARDFKKQYSCDNANNGCTLSHLQIIQRAHFLGLHAVMVFEDDAVLHDQFNNLLSRCMQDLPPDWDLLSFGGSHKITPVKITDHLYQTSRTLTTHGYIMRSTIFEMAIEKMQDLDKPVDCFMVDIQSERKCFITNPPIAWQLGGFSDIVGRDMRYSWISKPL